ncbi:Phosphate binding protein (modular protein) [Desulfamplus magnetovallimortis]|uniref:Phosphate-binding protein n=1 Tax=Desulfamplus magnetovallimortis TaxID=1246637 RepID=A0A1W1HF08_9BACT|nr:phosphate ABC transporter substrate-binding protein PstS family protein [Desulfamplus magnetovallimortis]SLM31091.1 Phosphate binding protein (modular protein) [Desulfamplus magnetovallimortis]
MSLLKIIFPIKKFLFVAFLTLLIQFPFAVTAKEIIRIQGSTTVFPIAQEAAATYMQTHKNVEIVTEGTGSGHGIKALIDGTTDIANASRFMKDKEAKMAYEKGAIPIPFRVAYDCILPVVHKSNPLKGIGMEYLKAIYGGEIKNWKEVGGKDAPISILSRDTSSGTYEVWKEKVMGDSEITPAVQLKSSNGEVKEAIMDNPDAIGYIGIGYLDNSVKPLAVDGIIGSEKSAVDGSYPISRPLFMFTRGWPTGELKRFINYMLEPTLGQHAVKKAGYLSVYLPATSLSSFSKTEPCPEPVPSFDHKKCPPCPACNESASCPPCPSCRESTPCPECPPCESVLSLSGESLSPHGRFESMDSQQKVMLVQQYLNSLGYSVGAIDGIWGPRSLNAYIRFQKLHNIEPVYSSIAYPVIQMMEKKIQRKDNITN